MPKQSGFFSIRVTEDVRASLAKAAKANRRSFAREIAARLEQSLTLDESLRGRFGDPTTRAFSMQVAILASIVQGLKRRRTTAMTGTVAVEASWREDAWTYLVFKAGVGELLALLAPGGPVEPPDHADKLNSFDQPEEVGRVFARSVVAMVRETAGPTRAPGMPQVSDWWHEIYGDLGLGEIPFKSPKRS